MTHTGSTQPIGSTRQKPTTKKWLVVFGCVIVILVGALVFVVISPKEQEQGPRTLPSSIVSDSEFHVYYPADFPDDMSLDESSIKNSDSMLFYTLQNTKDSGYITISQQSAPANVNPESFLRRPDREPRKISIGTVYDKSADGRSNFVVATTDNVLVYVYSSNNMDSYTTQLIINTLR